MSLLYGSTIRLTAGAEERGLLQQRLLQQGEERAKRVFSNFIDFAFSGNILEIALGLILANGFTTVTNSFVNDVLLPPLSIMIPLNRNMDEKFFVLKAGPRYEEQGGYNTIKLAKDDGAVVLAYGGFIRNVISFLILGFMLYVLGSSYQYFSKDDIIKHTVKCRYCKKVINDQAIRCVNCTSWLDGREERMNRPDYRPENRAVDVGQEGILLSTMGANPNFGPSTSTYMQASKASMP